MDHRDSSSGQTDGSLSISDGRGHTTSSYTHCHQGMLGCPNLAFRKNYASKRNFAKQKQFHFVSLQFRETTKKSFASFRFVSFALFR